MGLLDARGNAAPSGTSAPGGVWKGLDGLDIGLLSWSRPFRAVSRVTASLWAAHPESPTRSLSRKEPLPWEEGCQHPSVQLSRPRGLESLFWEGVPGHQRLRNVHTVHSEVLCLGVCPNNCKCTCKRVCTPRCMFKDASQCILHNRKTSKFLNLSSRRMVKLWLVLMIEYYTTIKMVLRWASYTGV